jgi:uncharacterized protein YbjT (DUF2867 family)
VANTVGIIRERRGASFLRVHTEAPIAMFDAAVGAGVCKLVQVSALGADPAAESRYLSSKGAADARLSRLGVPYVVLRPSIVYGPGDHSMTYFRWLAALPITPVPGDGRYRVQPLHVDDLVRALVMAVEREEWAGLAVDVGGAAALTFDALLDELARGSGRRRAKKLHIPWALMRLIAATTDALGGRGPITGEELALLRRGSVADNAAFIRSFGFEPARFDAALARRHLTRGRAAE